MNNDVLFPFILLLIPLGLVYIIYVIRGIIKGAINPYSFGVEKVCKRSETPVMFWINAISGLLIGVLLIIYAILCILTR